MDLLSSVRLAWQHKLVSLAIVAATIGGCAFVVFGTPPTYEAASSFVLIQPPAPPSAAEIRRDPALQGTGSDNPYNRYSDPSVILNVVARKATAETVRQRVAKNRGDIDFDVSPSRRFGGTSPILDISATGGSEAEVMETLAFVGGEVTEQLRRTQDAEGVDPLYMFTTRPVESPESAERLVSGTVRSLVAVVALGGLVLVLVLAGIQARAQARAPAATVIETPAPLAAAAPPGSGTSAPAVRKVARTRGRPTTTGDPAQAGTPRSATQKRPPSTPKPVSGAPRPTSSSGAGGKPRGGKQPAPQRRSTAPRDQRPAKTA